MSDQTKNTKVTAQKASSLKGSVKKRTVKKPAKKTATKEMPKKASAKKEVASKFMRLQEPLMKVNPSLLENWKVKQDVKQAADQTKVAIQNWFSPNGWEDGEFMDDVRQATLRGAHPLANLLFWCSFAFIVIMLIWANHAELDEVTHGEGKVIPSSKVQEIEHGEGGIVKEILVREGDVVKKGDVLLRIDDTEFASSFEEKSAKRYTLMAEIARLEYELLDEVSKTSVIEYPVEVQMNAPDIITTQNNIYKARKSELRSATGILEQQFKQKSQELKEANTKMGQTARAYEFSKKELDLTKPLLKDGVVSEVEILRLERTVNDLLGEKETAELMVGRVEFALEEAKQRFEEAVVKFMANVQVELGEKKEELQRLTEVLKADAYRVDRTTVRAPVDSSVKRVLVNTIGSVVGKDEVLVELIPIDDQLLVEAKVRPKDIAFLRPQQKAKVKITAYDFSIYGGLDAELEFIGADTVADEKGNPFYHIRVRTDKNYLGDDDNKLPIIPGMVATVDILTGKKTVLDYILKPFNKMRENAMRER